MQKSGGAVCSLISPGYHTPIVSAVTEFGKIIFTCLLIFLWINGFAQNGSVLYGVQYKETVSTYYVTDPAQQFTSPEIVRLRNSVVCDSVVKTMGTDHAITTTIYHVSDSRIESWMNQPAKTVIDDEKSIQYDQNGVMISQSIHSQQYAANHNKLKQVMHTKNADFIPEFPKMTAQLRNRLIGSGFQYSSGSEGSAVFIKDSAELRVNNSKLTFEIISYNGSGIVKSSVKKGFKKNSLGQIVPVYIIKKSWDERFPNYCVQKVEITDYENYKIIFDNSRHAAIPENTELLVYPNPVSDHLTLQLDADYFSDATIEIIDATGNMILKQYVEDMTEEVLLPVHDLSAGIYVIRIYDDHLQFNTTCYKN